MPAVHQKSVQQFDFYKYLRVVWRRKWLLIIPLAVCLPIAGVAAYWYPVEYESTAILELQDNRPQAEAQIRRFSAGAAVMEVQTRAMSWNAIREIVLSRKVDFGREIDPDNRHQLERIYHEVVRRTKVRPFGRKHMKVSHRSTRPEKNASLVNELVKKFVGEDRRLAQEKAKNDLKYYRDKMASAKAQLAEIDGQLREFNQANPWLGDTLAEVHREYKEAEEEEINIRRQIASVEAVIAELRKDLAKEEPEIEVKRTVEVSPEIRAARNRYDEALQRFKHFNDVFTPAHRNWQAAQRMLAEAKVALEQVDTGEEEEVVVETQPNPRYTALQERIAKEEKDHQRLEALKLEANKRVSECYVRQRKAPELLAERRALEEQRGVAAATVEDYGKGVRLAEKELNRLLTEAYSSRFRVVEYARDDRRPVKDTKIKIVVLGLMLGLLTGAGLVGLIEYLDQTFKTIDDAREYLGLTALGVIPAIYTPRDHRRKLWFRVLAVSSAVFVVGVAVAIYLTVPATREYLNMAWMWFRQQVEYW
jgi:capsular polysaccharide biosynthesis protein